MSVEFYNLMNPETKVPGCTNDKGHDFVELVAPFGNKAGWHEDRCNNCGIMIGYDTSD